jgi:hypothetical protein
MDVELFGGATAFGEAALEMGSVLPDACRMPNT